MSPGRRPLQKHGALGVAFSLACSACGAPPAPTTGAPGDASGAASVAPTSTSAPAAAAKSTSKAGALFDQILDEWLQDEPAMGRAVGLHEFDGRVADNSAPAIAKRTERLKRALADVDALDASSLTPDEALDRALLRGELGLALFRLVDVDEPRTRPTFYRELFEVDSYVNRNYAPLDERAKRLVAHERAALGRAGDVLKNLKSPMPKAVIDTAVKIYKGYAEYLRGDVAKLVGGAGDAAFREAFSKTNEDLAREADKIAAHLERAELPKGDDSHVLGPERFKKLLSAQEGLDVSLEEFRRMGEADLASNKKEFIALKAKVKRITRPKATELLAEATRLTEGSRRFSIERKLVTLPSDDRATVKETPPYMRWNSAFLDMPGPFDTAKESFYYITMPDPTWSAKEQEEYLMTHGILLATTVHEVYPGHFLQGQWVRRAPTRVQKMLSSYSFVEGWAHYGEQMMIEEGFGADDPQNRLGQLSDALLRNCRMVVSVGVHAQGMTLAQAEKRFISDCFQDKATARQQAARATFDPGYFAYTLGKIQILELRAEARKRLGEKFSLQRFHDVLLSHGSPPVPLIRDRVLAELSR